MDAPHCQVWSPRDHGFVVCRSLRLDDDSEAAPLQWRGTSRGEARRLVHRPAMRMEGANSRADARSVPRHAGVAVAVIVVAALLLSAIDDNSTPSPIQSRGRGASLLTRRPAMWSACPFPQGSAWDPETRLRRSRTLTLAAAAQAVSSIVDCRTQGELHPHPHAHTHDSTLTHPHPHDILSTSPSQPHHHSPSPSLLTSDLAGVDSGHGRRRRSRSTTAVTGVRVYDRRVYDRCDYDRCSGASVGPLPRPHVRVWAPRRSARTLAPSTDDSHGGSSSTTQALHPHPRAHTSWSYACSMQLTHIHAIRHLPMRQSMR